MALPSRSASSRPSTLERRCLSELCGTRFGDGQRTDISRKLTLRDIGHDLPHAITHADHSIFALIRALATRPGVVARDFTEGKRKRHFGPFAFLLISVGLASAIILITGVEWFSRRTRPAFTRSSWVSSKRQSSR